MGLDRETDVAVLKVEQTGLPALEFGDSEALHQGQIVLAFGSPLGLENSASLGVVSAVARQLKADDAMIYVQTDASINPGNSGGPLVDAAGRMVGLNTMILSQSGGNEGIGLAAPGNIVRSVYEQIRRDGRVRRGVDRRAGPDDLAAPRDRPRPARRQRRRAVGRRRRPVRRPRPACVRATS